MGLVKPDISSFAKIKVLGIGGGGGNAINSMIASGTIKGVDFVAANTDAQALLTSQAPIKIQIGSNLTKGLGAGSNPDVGREAAQESSDKVKELLLDTDMVFITCGMGGGTGTGGAPIIAQVSKETGALTVAVVTRPFLFEGSRRQAVAEEGIEELKKYVDTLIVIPNQRLLDVVDKKMTLLEAFRMADSILGQGVQSISDLITTPGLINVDFADVRTIMTAARSAINSPLLEVNLEGAKGILFNIIGGPNLSMTEVNEAAEIISQAADPDANIIFGATIDEDMGDQIKVSVIGTGFDENRQTMKKFISGSRMRTGGGQQTVSSQKKNDDDDNQQSTKDDLAPEDEFDIPAFLRQGR